MRTARDTAKLALVILAATWVAPLACSSKSDAPGVTCGEGTTQQGNTCVAVTPEAGAGSDGAAGEAESDAEPARPPVFAGVKAVAPVSESRLLVVWDPGTDAADPDGALAYRVYVGAAGQALSYAAPAVTTAPSARSVTLGGLDPGATYTIGVRAVSRAGVEDANVVTQQAGTQSDATAPAFAGLTSAEPGGSGAVQLAWAAATDALTPPAALTYLVYMAEATGTEDFTTPALVVGPGDVGAAVKGLPGATRPRFFVVRARDAAGNVDGNTLELSSAPGADTAAPSFGGCTAATTVASASIAISWSAAVDDTSSADHVTYDIFASTTSGSYDFTQPFATVKGADAVVIPGLVAGTRYSFVCRAKDEAGNEDANTNEVSARTGENAIPPTFAGLTGLAGDPVTRTATLTWAAGSDDTTAQNELLYDVYVSGTPGGQAFDRPPLATSTAGATTIGVSNLAPNAALYFVVRARDQDGNHDANGIEKSLVTNVSFSQNVQPILTHDCGVVGCHVPGNPAGGLILAPGFAYAQLVNVAALELGGLQLDGSAVNYVTPGDRSLSYLDIKVNAALFNAFKQQNPALAARMGTLMPAPSTGSTLTQEELTTIASWIVQGAVNN